MEIIADPAGSGLATDDLNSAFTYWASLRRDGALPRHRDLDPREIVGLLPKINLVDVYWTNDGRRYRHRLVGTGVVDFFRTDSTGQWFDDVYTANHLDSQLPAYDRAVCEQVPTIDTVRVPLRSNPLENGPDLTYWRLILPMTRRGDCVDLLFLLFDPVSTDPSYRARLPLYRRAGRDIDNRQ